MCRHLFLCFSHEYKRAAVLTVITFGSQTGKEKKDTVKKGSNRYTERKEGMEGERRKGRKDREGEERMEKGRKRG